MPMVARTDRSIVGRWWWTVDRWMLAGVLGLIAVGLVLVLAAGPAASARIGLDGWHFVSRQVVFLLPAIAMMLVISLFNPRGVRRLALVGFAVSWVLMVGAMLFGPEIKGAQRWLFFGPLSLQPSEFVKPFFAVVTAWVFAEGHKDPSFPGSIIGTVIYVMTAGVLVLQPDMGMTAVITAIWIAQLVLAGLPLIWMSLLGVIGMFGALGAYMFVPHVTSRVNTFMDPTKGDTYQIDRALESIQGTGFFGKGPGEGVVKFQLPDAHTDFIFAVAAEEFGFLVTLAIIALFAFIVLRGMTRLLQEEDNFVLLAASGLMVQFGLQAVINMGVNLKLMPTKGMTLPFISYGGSSLWALAIGMGMILALTRRARASSW